MSTRIIGFGDVPSGPPAYSASEKDAVLAKLARMEVSPRLYELPEHLVGADAVFVRDVVAGAVPPGRGNALAWARLQSASGRYVLGSRLGLVEPAPPSTIEGGALLAVGPALVQTLPAEAFAYSPVLLGPGEAVPPGVEEPGWWAGRSALAKLGIMAGIALVGVGVFSLVVGTTGPKRGYVGNAPSFTVGRQFLVTKGPGGYWVYGSQGWRATVDYDAETGRVRVTSGRLMADEVRRIERGFARWYAAEAEPNPRRTRRRLGLRAFSQHGGREWRIDDIATGAWRGTVILDRATGRVEPTAGNLNSAELRAIEAMLAQTLWEAE